MNTEEKIDTEEHIQPRQLITVKEACAILKISPPTFYTRLVGEGKIKLKQIGGVGVSRVELSDVHALIEDRGPKQLDLPGMGK